MSGTYDDYLAAVDVLAHQAERIETELRAAEQLGTDEVRAADRQLTETRDEVRRTADVLRTTGQRLDRIARVGGQPPVSTPGTLRLPSLASVATALADLDRELDRAARSADWVERNRSAVVVAPVRTSPASTPVVLPQTEVATTAGAKSVFADWRLWAGVAAVLVVALVVVLVTR